MLVLRANIYKLYDDCFLFTVMLVLFILPNILLCAQCWETQRKVKHGTEIVIEVTLRHQSERSTTRLLSCYYSLPESCLNELFQKEIQQQILYPFFICNVYSSVNRLHREKPTVVWSNFCFYSVQYCTVSVENGKLTWISCYVFCFVIMECNCTIRPLYFKNTLFFTSLYLYVSMYVCTERKTNVYFLYLSLHVLISLNVSLFLCPVYFIKQLYLILLLNVCVCVRIKNNHIPMQFHVGSWLCMVTLWPLDDK